MFDEALFDSAIFDAPSSAVAVATRGGVRKPRRIIFLEEPQEIEVPVIRKKRFKPSRHEVDLRTKAGFAQFREWVGLDPYFKVQMPTFRRIEDDEDEEWLLLH